MEKRSTRLSLKPGVEVFRDAKGCGLKDREHARYVKNDAESAILKAMEEHHFTLEELIRAAGEGRPKEHANGIDALTLAGFILDFEEFLEK